MNNTIITYFLLLFFQFCMADTFAQSTFHAKPIIPQTNALISDEEQLSEAKVAQQFIQDLYYPQTGLTLAQHNDIEEAVKKMPIDPSEKMRAPGWEFIGPDYIANNADPTEPINKKWSGRVTCVEYTDVFRVSSALGGLYEGVIVLGIPVWNSIGDSIPSRAISAFATNPQNTQTIIVGTGEYSFSGSPISPAITPFGAAGLWITHDGGTTWNKANCNPLVDNVPFEKIVFAPGDSTLVYAAGLNGAYYSLDGGNYWQQIPPPTSSAIATDIAAASDGIHVLMGYVRNLFVGTGTPSCAYYGNTILSFPQYLTNDFVVQGKQPYDVKLAYAASNSAIAYASCSYFGLPNNPPNDTNSVIFRSLQYGAPNTWQKCNIYNSSQTAVLGFHWNNQGFRDNIIGVSPTDPNKVVVGGGPTFYSNDGLNFYQTDGKHADQCAIAWKPDGSQALLGNDGGVFYSNNGGQTWEDDINYLPITQAYFIDVDPQNPQKIILGTQDNGILIYNTTTTKWEYGYGGDGGDCIFHPTNNNIVYGTIGGSDFIRSKSITSGIETTWQDIETNISHSNQSQFNSPIATDFVAQNYLYSSHGTLAYISLDGATWTNLNPNAPFPTSAREIAVGSSANPHVYFALNPNASGSIPRLDVDGSPYLMTSVNAPISNGYPRALWAELNNSQSVYCAMGGSNVGFSKVFRSSNAGGTWTNITGDLPFSFPPITDIWVDALDTLNIVISTERGCFKTNNGGTNWYRWSYGLPKNMLVTDIDYGYENGKTFAFIATFGRGIWKREITDADPFQVGINPELISQEARLTCFPNPMSDKIDASFWLPEKANVELSITNILGQKLLTKSAENVAGNQNYTYHFEVSNLPSGIFFCELKYNQKRLSTKLIKQ